MVEGREDSASLIKVVWMSLSGRYSSQHTCCMHWAVCSTHSVAVTIMVPLILHGEHPQDWFRPHSLQQSLGRNLTRGEQQNGQDRAGNWFTQSKFIPPGRKDISFRSHALQIHGTKPYFQGILTADWLQHFELLRKANVRREIWPVCIQTLLFFRVPSKKTNMLRLLGDLQAEVSKALRLWSIVFTFQY